MTDSSAIPPTNRRYRLRTFGTLALSSPDDDTVLGRHSQQHRRLALLAVLAAAGDAGRSRDQLLFLFWPEGTQSRARHSLDQLLYAIRTSIDEAVFAGVSPVRLNSDLISSDIAEFQGALERSDLHAAVAAYRGPFLDGFHLGDAPEFDQWLEGERSRLKQAYSGALERLAQNAERAGDHPTAVGWWRRLAETDPVSTTNATRLIRALMNTGDHAAALKYAEQYEAVVAQELGTAAGPAVANLVAEARATSRAEPVAETKGPAFSSRATSLPAQADARPTVATTEPPVTEATVSEAAAVHEPVPRHRPRRRAFTWMAGGLIAFAALAAAVWLRAAPDPPEDRSIAVLPFTNLSGDQQDATLVDGVTEELISALTQIPDLRVIARTSSFAFRNSTIGARRIADSLRVSNLIEGEAHKVGSRLRVQVRLIHARKGSTRWVGTYDRDLKDIFAVRADIANAVARELDLRLGDGAIARIRRSTVHDIGAYELYLRGNDPVLLRSDSGARAALAYFQQAVAVDSAYAAAYAGLARMHMRIAFGNDMELPRPERLALAELAALKAVALDDSSGDAHAALSMVRRNNYDLAGAEAELKQAIALNPTNARFHEWMVLLLIATERPVEALTEARLSLQLDPFSPTANAEVANALLANDRCDEALAQLEKLKSLRPPLLRAGAIAAQCYTRKGMWPEAIAEGRRISVNGGPRGQAILGHVLARGGHAEEAREILTALLTRARRTSGTAFDVAIVYAALGENDLAFTWLDRSVADRSLGFEWLTAVVEDLRRDPRFEQFQRRAGLQ